MPLNLLKTVLKLPEVCRSFLGAQKPGVDRNTVGTK